MNSDTKPVQAPLLPGSTIGILGGGQLGRMLAVAASKLGISCHIYCPDPDSPAFEVAKFHTIASYEDKNAIEKFARSVDLVTYEFENVHAKTARQIEDITLLAPGENALQTTQDRLLEKQFLQKLDIPVAEFEPVNSEKQLQRAIDIIGTPSVLKTTRFGYDGKGQRMLKVPEDGTKAYEDFAGIPLVLEAFVKFECEISVVLARNGAGQIKAYEPSLNVHKNHILHTSTVPAKIENSTAQKAISMATKIVEALEYQGVLAVEFFVCSKSNEADLEQTLLVNEIAPRVHNSGHWTQNGCSTDQFEQHIRAICNWSLGDTRRLADITMRNLIGGEINLIPHSLLTGDHPHIYGKSQSRPGRKMGHINTLSPLSK